MSEPQNTSDPWDRLDDEYAEPWTDPIVAEVRAARAVLLDEAGGTLEGLYQLLKARETESGAAYVQPPRRAGTA